MQAARESFTGGGLSYLDGQWHPGMPLGRTSATFPGDSEAAPVVKVPLQEVITVPRHMAVRRVEGVAEAGLAARMSAPLPPEAIQVLPEGPSAGARHAQRFTIMIDATGQDGRRARGVVQGPDTYGSTAIIAAEGACRLTAGPARPGVLAPAQAFDPAGFLDALAPHGITWTIEPPTTAHSRHPGRNSRTPASAPGTHPRLLSLTLSGILAFG